MSNAQRKPAILVVDDLLLNRMILSSMVMKLGFSVLEANDGLEACDIYNKEKGIVAVILDLNMPLLDGWQTAERLRKMEDSSQCGRPGTTRMPVIVCTANDLHAKHGTDSTVCSSALSAGADEVLHKPMSMPKLKLALDRYLPFWRDIVSSPPNLPSTRNQRHSTTALPSSPSTHNTAASSQPCCALQDSAAAVSSNATSAQLIASGPSAAARLQLSPVRGSGSAPS